MSDDLLKTYRTKRDFESTPEPEGKLRTSTGRGFVIQKHAASRLHYDFRLELDGVLKSWAVPKGPSLDPADRRLAVRTEDHPVDYGEFEGVIPAGYGAGTVMLWDQGKWSPEGDAREGLQRGSLKFRLDGERLQGGFALVRMRTDGEKRENWLLIKQDDDYADETLDPTEFWSESVTTGRSMVSIKTAGPEKNNQGRATKGAAGTMRNPAGSTRLRFIPPQLATLRDEPPAGDDWLHELKYDGYRIQALIDSGGARLVTRNGKDWTQRYPAAADALADLDVNSAVIDGELVALDSDGRSNFSQLQNVSQGGVALIYYAFDLLHHDGEKITDLPLIERKQRLHAVIAGAGDPVRYSDHIRGEGERVIENACAMQLEGIISKKANATYRSGRSRSWIKSKCVHNEEFVIAGYRQSEKKGRPFSSLLLAEYQRDRLVYRGRVGTGFDETTLRALAGKMQQLERKTSPLAETPDDAQSRAVWLTPKLVAQIAFTELTADGRLRHPTFLGLREDKSAEEVQSVKRGDEGETVTIAGVRLTSPDRVVYPEQGVSKRAVAEYLAANAEHVLRFLKGRPVSLVRCPSGRSEDCFFQKHHSGSMPEQVDQIEIEEKQGGKQPYLVVNDVKGLVACAQMGTLELHLWGARSDRIERPERIVFDLDPDEGLDFAQVKEAAVELRGVLQSVGLQSFALLTGGKGVHVVVPVERRRGWDDTKTFARGLAKKLAAAAPDRYVATASKAKRKNRIYIDWLRNERGATAIAPYSPRARAGAPVATPVTWAELGRIDSAVKYSVDSIGKRLARLKTDPWQEYEDVRQSLTKAALQAVT